MKTIIKSSNKVSLYVFNDAETVDIQSDKIIIGNPEKYIIGDYNSSNASLVEGVAELSGWIGHKFLYDGEWKSNPDYVEPPSPPEIES